MQGWVRSAVFLLCTWLHADVLGIYHLPAMLGRALPACLGQDHQAGPCPLPAASACSHHSCTGPRASWAAARRPHGLLKRIAPAKHQGRRASRCSSTFRRPEVPVNGPCCEQGAGPCPTALLRPCWRAWGAAGAGGGGRGGGGGSTTTTPATAGPEEECVRSSTVAACAGAAEDGGASRGAGLPAGSSSCCLLLLLLLAQAGGAAG